MGSVLLMNVCVHVVVCIACNGRKVKNVHLGGSLPALRANIQSVIRPAHGVCVKLSINGFG